MASVFAAAGELLAHLEADARSFLFPEPKLVAPSSGVDREVLMTRSPVFPVRTCYFGTRQVHRFARTAEHLVQQRDTHRVTDL